MPPPPSEIFVEEKKVTEVVEELSRRRSTRGRWRRSRIKKCAERGGGVGI